MRVEGLGCLRCGDYPRMFGGWGLYLAAALPPATRCSAAAHWLLDPPAVQGSGFRVQGAGFRVWGVGCGVWGLGSHRARCTLAARPPCCVGCRVQGSGRRVQGSGCRVQGSGFRVQGSGCRAQGSGCRVQGSGLGVQGSGFRVWGLGFGVWGFGLRV